MLRYKIKRHSFIHLFIQSVSNHFKYLLCARIRLIKIDMNPDLMKCIS